MKINANLKAVNLKGGLAVIQLETRANNALLDIARHVGDDMEVSFESDQITLDITTGEIYD